MRGCPQGNGQWLVSLPLPVRRAGMNSGDRSLMSVGWDSPRCSHSAGPAGKTLGLCSWRKPPSDRANHTWSTTALRSRSGDQRRGGEGHLAHLKTCRPLACFPERPVRNNYEVFPTREKHHKTKPTQGLLTQLPDA